MFKFSFRMSRLKYAILLIALFFVAKCSELLFIRSYPQSTTTVHSESPWDFSRNDERNDERYPQSTTTVHIESLWDFSRNGERNDDIPDAQRYTVKVDVTESLHITLPRYISINIDANQIRNRLRGLDFSSPKLRAIASALSPTNIRWGGTYADFLHFDPTAVDGESLEKQDLKHRVDTSTYPEFADSKKLHYVTLTGARWDNMTRFCDAVGWDIMWDFNLFVWKDGQWDPSEADEFLKYSASRGIRMPSFQLGNEPNSFRFNFNFTLDPEVLVQGFKSLKDVISRYPQYDSSQIYGPESTNLDKYVSSRNFLTRFLQAGGCEVVTEICLHHYYVNSKTATVEEFMDPKIMDTLKVQMEYAYNITREHCRVPKPIRFTETSSAYGGGAGGLSDSYVSGFLWLDKLGLAAKYRVTHVFRQSFFGGLYAMVDRDLNPNPDLFLSVLYKRLVEGPVLNVTNSDIPQNLRLYAHCVRNTFYGYPPGALVLYYLYMGTTPVSLGLNQFHTASGVYVFSLTPGDSDGLKSKKMKLNNVLLEVKDNQFPIMSPRFHLGNVPLPPQSYGFIVIPDAEVQLCKLYHRSTDVGVSSRQYIK